MKEPTYEELRKFVAGIADYIRYGEKPGWLWEAGEDAIETANACIEGARAILGLPETSAEEEQRAADEGYTPDEEEAA